MTILNNIALENNRDELKDPGNPIDQRNLAEVYEDLSWGLDNFINKGMFDFSFRQLIIRSQKL